MATAEALLTAAYDFVQTADSAAATQVDITVAAPSSDKQHIVQGVEFSVSAAPGAAVKVQLIEDLAGAATVLDAWQVPAVAIAPVSLRFKGIKVAAGKSITLRIPSLGGTAVATGTLLGLTRMV